MESGLRFIGYAMIKNSSPEGVEYDPAKWLDNEAAGGREIRSTPQGSLQEVDAGSRIVLSFNRNDGYEHSLTLLDILDDVDKDWLNKKTTSSGSTLEVADNKPNPRFALLVAKETFNADHLYNVDIYFNTTASRYEKGAKSHKPGEDYDFEFPQYTLTSRPLETNNYVCHKIECDELPTTIVMPTIPSSESSTPASGSGSGSSSSSSSGSGS